MIHGVVQEGTILALEPVPADWNGREVTIEAAAETLGEDRAAIERWYAEMEALGPAQYEAGEREAIERVMAEADGEAKEQMKRTWACFDDVVSS